MTRYFFISESKAEELSLPTEGLRRSKDGKKIAFNVDSLLHIGSDVDTIASEHGVELISHTQAVLIIKNEF